MKYADEIQLVKEAQGGSRAAFAELVCRYRTSAYAAAYVRLRNHHDAEDIAQEAFLSIFDSPVKLLSTNNNEKVKFFHIFLQKGVKFFNVAVL